MPFQRLFLGLISCLDLFIFGASRPATLTSFKQFIPKTRRSVLGANNLKFIGVQNKQNIFVVSLAAPKVDLSHPMSLRAYRINNGIVSRHLWLLWKPIPIYKHLKIERAPRHSNIVIRQLYYRINLGLMVLLLVGVRHLSNICILSISQSVCVLRIRRVNMHIIIPDE